eukprot:8498186-Karenia_brevis.AAC.1
MPHVGSRNVYFRRRQHFDEKGYVKSAKSGSERTKLSDALAKGKREPTANAAKTHWAGASGRDNPRIGRASSSMVIWQNDRGTH